MKLGSRFFFAALALYAFVVPSCSRIPSVRAVEGAAIQADEQAAALEKQKNIDFSSPQIIDADKKPSRLPEDLVWHTSRPGVFGSSRAKRGGTLKTYLTAYPETFRSAGPMADSAARSLLPVNVACVEINMETKEWMPAAATHWAFGKDGHSVYFLLNDRMKWSDGVPVSADDYVFMLTMMRSEYIHDPWRNEYYGKKVFDLEKVDEHAIRVWLADTLTPDELLYRASVQPRPLHFFKDGIIPEDYVTSHNWIAEPTTGPYRLAEFVKGDTVILRKVENWWGFEYDYNAHRYNVDVVDMRLINGGLSAAKVYFYKGLVDSLPLTSPQDWADSAEKSPIAKGYVERYWARYVPTQGFQGIFLNTEFPLFSQLAVRTGLGYALNIQEMIDVALRGEYVRYHNTGIGHVFAGVDFDDDSLRAPGFDIGKAIACFESAGYTKINASGIRENGKGEALGFELLYGTSSHTERLAVLREQAKRVGVDVRLKLMQAGAFTALSDRKYEAYWGSLSTGELPDYDQVRSVFGWSSPASDSLIASYKTERNLEKKAKISKSIQGIILDAALVIPGYYLPHSRAASWKWVRYPEKLTMKYQADFTDPLGAGYFWLDEDIREEVVAALATGKTFKPRTHLDDAYKSK